MQTRSPIKDQVWKKLALLTQLMFQLQTNSR
jgi:hypothetical protein